MIFKKFRQRRADKRKAEILEVIGEFPPKELFDLMALTISIRGEALYFYIDRSVREEGTKFDIVPYLKVERSKIKIRLTETWKDKTEAEIEDILNEWYGTKA